MNFYVEGVDGGEKKNGLSIAMLNEVAGLAQE